jgi:3',5'-cyclic AMP phosphodiesterase CpdA
MTLADEGGWRGPVDFIQLADPQLGMLHQDVRWEEEVAMLRRAIEHANRLRPRFVLVSGDLVNKFGGSDEQQLAALGRALGALDAAIPIVLQPGNHDLGQVPTPASVARYVSRHGDDFFSFWTGGVCFLSLNSQYYLPRGAEQTGSLGEAQLQWLEREVAGPCGARKRRAHVVMLSHAAPFVGAEEEAHGWANWALPARRAALAAAARAGAKLWLSGHFHGNAAGRSGGGVEVVTTSACGSMINWTAPAAQVAPLPTPDFNTAVGSPAVVAGERHSGVRLVRVRAEAIEHRWFTMAAVPRSFDAAFPGVR